MLAVRSSAVVGEEAQQQSRSVDRAGVRSATSTFRPEQLPARLEQTLALGRASWPLATLRAFADKLLALAEGRRKNAAHESRWLNLTGFCLRPGFGFPGDEFRIEQVRRDLRGRPDLCQPGAMRSRMVDLLRAAGRAGSIAISRPTSSNASRPSFFRNRSETTHQPKPLREMWRTAASLELLPVQTKVQLGDTLIAMLKQNEMVETCLWCLSRLGARRLFRGPINQVFSPSVVARWVETILARPASPALLECSG